MKKALPPKWADKFLEWYCRPDLLEEIQGDAHELFFRMAKQNAFRAKMAFAWNVMRFFRWRNINKVRLSKHPYSIDMLQNIFKVAIRNFLRQPGHSLLNVVGLAVSFTAAILIGLWIFHETSFDRFHQNPEQIFKVMSHVDGNGVIETYSAARGNINLEAIPEISEKAIVISGTRWPNELCFRPETNQSDCIYLFGVFSEKAFFNIFDFPIIKGDKSPLAKPTNIAISQRMSQKLFGSDEALGKTIKIDGHFLVTVASVFRDVPANSSLQFEFVLPVEVFGKMRGLPADYFAKDFQTVYFKTHSPASREELTQKLNQPSILTEDLRKDKVSYSAFPLVDTRLHGEFVNGKNTGGRIQYVKLFIIVAMLVVVMAVINFINLSTARAANRAKEIGVRKVTGANRLGIIIQFLGESFLVVVVALILSLLVAQVSLPFFNGLMGETLISGVFDLSVVSWVFAFLIVISIAAGLYPAVIVSSFHPASILKGTTSNLASGGQRLRKVLLITQVAVSLGIVVFTGVLFRQLSFIQNKNLGLDTKNILHIEPTYKLLKQYDAFKNELLAMPSIQQVTATNADPIDLTVQTTGVKWPGMPDGMNAAFKILGGNYELTETFGLKILDGRMFGPKAKDSLHTEVVVSASAVKRMELQQPVGTIIKIGDSECVIIGVVNDFHTSSLKQEQLPVIIYSHTLLQCSRLYVRYAQGSTRESFAKIESVYKKFEPEFAMKYHFLDETFDNMYKTEHTASTMLVFFTLISLVIAVIGVVGLATYTVAKKKKEISIKRVFGASVWQVLQMLCSEFAGLICLAAFVGLPLAWYGTVQWLSSYAYRIDTPWWIYVASFAGIMTITLLLILLQGLRATRANPSYVLRSE